MNIDISTPSLLFPAITLLLLAYTNKFLAIATLIRNLKSKYEHNSDKVNLMKQITNLRKRVRLIKWMQIFGIFSFLLCVLSMISIFQNQMVLAKYIFGASLFSLVTSLILSLLELQISTKALEIELESVNK